jgi:hypothetical protein
MTKGMRNELKLFIFFFSLITLGGSCCKKDNSHTTVEGFVINETNNAAVADAVVMLMARNPACFSCASGVVQTYKADSKGKFSFEFEADKDLIYTVGANKQNYYANETGMDINNGQKNKSIFVRLKPYGYLKIHIKNTQPIDDNDLIGFNSFCTPIEFYGQNIDTTFLYCRYCGCPFLGNEYNTIYYWITKNGVKKVYSASVYCPAFDTTTYSINY